MSTKLKEPPIRRMTVFRSLTVYLLLPFTLLLLLAVTWLRWESSLPREDWFGERQGRIEKVDTEEAALDQEQLSESVRLVSDTGLKVSFRVIRKANPGDHAARVACSGWAPNRSGRRGSVR